VFLPLVDSLPPDPPTHVEAKIDTSGNVILKWKRNADEDIFGYTVYRSNVLDDEFTQVTSAPITDTVFHDKVNVRTLSSEVFYRIAALDYNQNHSNFSTTLKVALPDNIKPQPPLMSYIGGDPKGIIIKWLPSPSRDVMSYNVYRKQNDSKSWIKLTSVNSANLEEYTASDTNILPADFLMYTVIALDDAGLESLPATPLSFKISNNILHEPVTWGSFLLSKESKRVTIKWIYKQAGVKAFYIYRSVNSNPMVLYKTEDSKVYEYNEQATPNTTVTFKIMAIFNDETKSALSEALTIQL
jgi:fibronectin type 3 domain-containing protein